MKVLVNFLINLEEITDKREKQIEIPATITVGEFLGFLSKKYGNQLTNKLYDEKRNLRGYWILINGKSIAALQGLETTLKDGDRIAIVPAASGG